MPKGCYIQLERKAKDYILDTIRSSYSNKTGLIARIASFSEDTGLNLSNFLSYYHLEMKTIYKTKESFARLCVLGKVHVDFEEVHEATFSKALGRIAEIDSRRWISFLLEILTQPGRVTLDRLGELEIRMLQMFHYTIWQKPLSECGFSSLEESLIQLNNSPVLLAEILEILRYNYDHIDFMDEEVDLDFPCPLDLHCNYSRDQILVAMDFLKPNTVREGVKYLAEKKSDVFFITLNKSEKDYSPSTLYRDYSIDERLFHWQSQSTTSADSPTGQRYINHKALGSNILLFVREYKNDPSNTSRSLPYTFLGLADYVQHEGSRPMNITWRLHRPIPAKYLKKTNKLIVG